MLKLAQIDWQLVPVIVPRWTKQGADLGKQVREATKDLPPLMPGYGQILWNPNTKQLWLVSGDSDEWETVKQWKDALEKVPGVEDVRCEAEYSPIGKEKHHGEGWVKLAYSPTLRRMGEIGNYFPNEFNQQFGGPTPLAAALTSGALGAAAGYGVGWLGEQLLPAHWRTRKLRRTLATLGGIAGVAPAALWAHINHITDRPLNSGELLNHPVVPNEPSPTVEKFSEYFHEQFGHHELGQDYKAAMTSFTGAMNPTLNVDAFNRVIWEDPLVANRLPAPVQSAASGLVTAASQAAGSPFITPSDIGRVTLGMGSGYVSGALVGKALGLLMGMPQQTQNQLKNVGMWAGIVKSVVPIAFGSR